MNLKHIKYKTTLLLITLIITASCSNNKQSISASDISLRTAEMHERSAKDYRNRGVDSMADYHNDEAQREREKAINSCDLYDITLSIITLGFFDCE